MNRNKRELQQLQKHTNNYNTNNPAQKSKLRKTDGCEKVI